MLILLSGVFLTSCLKNDLPKYENWDLNLIDNVYVEYRYEGDQEYNGQPVVEYMRLNVNKTVDEANNTILLDITVPNATGSFTDAERVKVVQTHLWMYMDISTAATIEPVGNAPKLGDVADLTQPYQYKVTAANGDAKTWTIKVQSFTK